LRKFSSFIEKPELRLFVTESILLVTDPTGFDGEFRQEVGRLYDLNSGAARREAGEALREMRNILDGLAGDPEIGGEVEKLLFQLQRIDDAGITAEEDPGEVRARELARKMAAEAPLAELGDGYLGAFVSELVAQVLDFEKRGERERQRRRQAEGIAAAKAQGVQFGRKVRPLPENFDEIAGAWRRGEISMRKAAAACGMACSTFSEAVKRMEDEGGRARSA